MLINTLAAGLLIFASGFFLGHRFWRRKTEKSLLLGSREINRRLKEKNQLAREAHDRILATLGSMAEGVIIVDAQGKTLLINTALLDALGLKKNTATGAYFWEIFRDSEVNEMIEICLKERRVVQKEHSVLLSDKTFEIQASPVFLSENEDQGMNFLGAVCVFHDVTRLKELERVRTEFVANVSHELKTPLTSILGYVETLKEGAVEDKQNRMKFLSTVEDHAKSLSELVEDLLLLSSVESDKSVLRIQPADLEKICESVTGYLNFKILEKKIKIEKDISPKPFPVYVDPALFERVLSNLLDNAIKYSPAGGKVVLRARQEAAHVLIEIIDEGIGIQESHIPRIFERFYRVDKSRSRESGGTGLGLSIVKHIVESHGGKIEVISSLQKGSKFSIRLQYNQ